MQMLRHENVQFKLRDITHQNMAEKLHFFAQKIYHLKLAHVHNNTQTLLSFILESFWLMLPFICICNTQCLGYYVHPLSI